MKKEERSRLLSACLLFVLSLACLLTVTLAWFAQNDRTGASGLQIGVQHSEFVLGCEYYAVSRTSGGRYDFQKVDPAAASLGRYNLLDDRSQLLLKIYVSHDVAALTVSGKTETTAFIGDAENALRPESDAAWKESNLLSSVVRLTVLSEEEAAAITDVTGTDGNPYRRLPALPADARFSSFVTENGAGHALQNTIALRQGSDTADTAVTSSAGETYAGETCRAVWVLVDYDAALLTTVFSRNLTNDEIHTGGTDTYVPFACDFYLELNAA